MWPQGDHRDEAFLLGVLSSIPLDWYARRVVEQQLDNHVVEGFPIPRPSKENDTAEKLKALRADWPQWMTGSQAGLSL